MFKDRNSRTKINIFVHTSYFYEYIIYSFDKNVIMQYPKIIYKNNYAIKLIIFTSFL